MPRKIAQMKWSCGFFLKTCWVAVFLFFMLELAFAILTKMPVISKKWLWRFRVSEGIADVIQTIEHLFESISTFFFFLLFFRHTLERFLYLSNITLESPYHSSLKRKRSFVFLYWQRLRCRQTGKDYVVTRFPDKIWDL